MNLVVQPEHSTACGHAVVAMLANTTTERVIAVLGHRRPTTWRELCSMLFAFGVVCEPEMVPVFSVWDLPHTAVLALPGRGRYGHWVAIEGEEVYDPAGAIYPTDTLRFLSPSPSDIIMCGAVRGTG